MNIKIEDFNKDFNWTEKEIIGLAILIEGGKIDSFGNYIDEYSFYKVGKHKKSGKVAIVLTRRNFEDECVDNIMRRLNKFK